jgi:hypothetical protein
MKDLLFVLPDGLTCHQVCAWVFTEAQFFHERLAHVRGYFALNGVEHSWLSIREDEIIFDLYPWAAASTPILVTTKGALNPWRRVYIELPPTHPVYSR